MTFKLGKEMMVLHRLQSDQNVKGAELLDLNHLHSKQRDQSFIESALDVDNLTFPLGGTSVELGLWLHTLQRYLGVELTAYMEQRQRAPQEIRRCFGDPILWSGYYISDGVDLRKPKNPKGLQLKSLIESLSPSLHKPLHRISPLKFSIFNPVRQKVRRGFNALGEDGPLSVIESHFRQQEFCHHLNETLTWLFFHMSESPQLLGQVRDELQSVVKDGVYHAKDLKSLPLTLGVILETLRLAPPYWLCRWDSAYELLSSKSADQELTMLLNAGYTLLSSPYLHHRDVAYWPSPSSFVPRRFQAVTYGGPLPATYYPCGPGPRGRSLLISVVHSCIALMSSVFRRARISLYQGDAALNQAKEAMVDWSIERETGVGFGAPQALMANIEIDESFVYIPSARV